MATATFLSNQLPSPLLKFSTPYQLLFSKPPIYDALRVFGCLCYASTLVAQRTKFSPRAVTVVFVGYPVRYKGYKLYNLETRQFFISRDVKFCESVFPFHKSSAFEHLPNLFGDVVLPTPQPDLPIVPPPDLQPANPDSPLISDGVVHIEHSDPTSVATRRSTRVSRPPSYLNDCQCAINSNPYPIIDYVSYHKISPTYKNFVCQLSSEYEPTFYHQAAKFPHWQQAMSEELQAMEENNTWSVVPLPKGKHSIGCRWVYKVKYKLDGQVDRYKARLVAKGYTQQVGVDFLDTFSPVAKVTTVRILMSIAAIKHWSMLQLDINNAFLNGDLFEEVYVDLPLGFSVKGENLVCKLHKSIYGLRQASRQWFHKFSTALTSNGFVQSKSDYSLFHIGSGDKLVLLLVYVDDIIVASPNSDLIQQVKGQLQHLFKLKVIGDLKYFLGLEIARFEKGINLS